MKVLLELSGLFLGVLVRTLVPYIRKLRQDKIRSFNKSYLNLAVSSLILSTITLLLILPGYKEIKLPVDGFYSGMKIFSTAFLFAFTCNTVLNEIVKWKE